MASIAYTSTDPGGKTWLLTSKASAGLSTCSGDPGVVMSCDFSHHILCDIILYMMNYDDIYYIISFILCLFLVLQFSKEGPAKRNVAMEMILKTEKAVTTA